MKKLFLSLLWLFIILISCSSGKNGIDVEIINSSEATINDVVFSTFGNTKLFFDKIEHNQCKSSPIRYSKNDDTRNDSCYYL